MNLLHDECTQINLEIYLVQSLNSSSERSIKQSEMMNRKILTKGPSTTCDSPARTKITETVVVMQNPGKGKQRNELPKS